jgi:hypothetical protein
VRTVRAVFEIVLLAMITACPLQGLHAQDLAPRAYVISPIHPNTITLAWSFYDGNTNYSGALPISGATGTYRC